MIFNSVPFAVFFTCFFFLYWWLFQRSLKMQNLLVLAGSYFFYAWWDWRFLLLIIGSSLLTYILGLQLHRSQNEKVKSLWLFAGVFTGVGFLLYFKYLNFFITSLLSAFALLHIDLHVHTLRIILPLGISFYTFRTLSYLFDINNGKIKPTTDIVVFFSYVAFFPSLVSGPIDRAKTLIPQLEKPRVFDYELAADGMRQILWGLSKKIIVADNCAAYTNQIFDAYSTFHGSTLVLGAFFYTVQMYADFSGYSDMAIGFSKLIGFRITQNFNSPYFAQNIAEYWRRWHISLTSWLTDYIFTPISIRLRDWGNAGLIIGIITTFLVSGLWHGANWTFIVWGFLHGCYFIPLILSGNMNKKKKMSKDKLLPSRQEAINILSTFILVMLSFVLFRSNTIHDAFHYFRGIFSLSLFSIPEVRPYPMLVCILLFIVIEWLGRERPYALEVFGLKWPRFTRWAFYYMLIIAMLYFGGQQAQFLYFQF